MSFLAELRRRNVFRAGALYLVAGWLLLQVADVLAGVLGLPEWTMRLVAFLLALGFPLVVIFSWVFELTPEGIKRESEIDRSESITPQTGRRLNAVIAVLLALAVGFLAWERIGGLRSPTGAATDTTPIDTSATSDADAGQSGMKSIAVLPFVNISADADNEYFSDGISEELLNVLVRVDGIKVASRTSSFAFKGKEIGIPEIAEQLNVDHVLEGSVRKAGNRVRVTAQLIDVKTDRHIWSQTYDRELEDIFAIQDEISSQIVQALEVALGAEARQAFAHAQKSTDNLEAYEVYLQGRYFWQRRGADNVRKAIDLFTRATDMDPGFARAWSSLAAAYITLPNYTGEPFEDTNEAADKAARKALELDDTLGEAHAVLGDLARFRYEWQEAESHYQEAVRVEPRNATVHLWYGEFLFVTGRLRDALTANARAYELDPISPGAHTHASALNRALGNFELAEKHARTAVELDQSFGLQQLGAIHYIKGEYEEALDYFEQFEDAIDADPRTSRAFIDAMRNPDEKETILGMLDEYADRFSDDVLFWFYTQLGQLDDVFAITESRELRIPPNGIFVFWARGMAPMRQDPRFKSMVRQLGLVDYWENNTWADLCEPRGDDFVCR